MNLLKMFINLELILMMELKNINDFFFECVKGVFYVVFEYDKNFIYF